MSKMRRKIEPAFTTKPEAEFVREPAREADSENPVNCPNCEARLVVRVAGGDAALDLARCQQCGTVYKIENEMLVPYEPVVPEAKKDLAKVMTNDETPRCPYCNSAKIQELPAMMMSFNRWTCNDCHGSFRAPVKGKAA